MKMSLHVGRKPLLKKIQDMSDLLINRINYYISESELEAEFGIKG